MTISLLDGPDTESVYADPPPLGPVALVEPLSTKPRVDLLSYVLVCSSAIEESDVQKSLTFCYNRSLACTCVRCWAKRLPDNNCSRLIQRSLRASNDGGTQVIFELEDTVVKVRSNWGKFHQ